MGIWPFTRNNKQVSILVCAHEDSVVVEQVLAWLRDHDFEVELESSSVVGSQEIILFAIRKGNINAQLILETYQGVILTTRQEHVNVFSDIRIAT